MSIDRLTYSEVEAAPVLDGDLLDQFTMFRDEAAFRELVMRHSRLVMGVCRRVLRCRHDAEDAFQATFFVLARGARRIRRGESIAAWLYGTAYRVARRMRDKKTRRREVSLPESIAVNGDVLAELAHRCDGEAFDEELNRLPAKYREPLVLHYLLGRTARETAAELGLTVRTVEGRLRRGKSELRYRLIRRGVSLALVGGAMAQVHAAEGSVAATLVDETIDGSRTYASGNVTSNAASLAAEELSTMSITGIPSSMVAAAVALFLVLGGVQPRSAERTAANELMSFRYRGVAATSGMTERRSTFAVADARSQARVSADATDADDESSQPPGSEAEPAQDALPGRIFLDVHLGVPQADGMGHVWGVIRVDPNTGEWEVVSGANIGSLRMLPDGKFGLISIHDRVQNESRIHLLDVQAKASRDLGPFSGAIPSRDGKMAIVTQAAFPGPDGPGLRIATGFKHWRLNLATLEKKPLPIPKDHLLLDASGDLEWCLTLRTMVKQDEPQTIVQRVVVMKTDGSGQRPLIVDDDSRHGFACFAPGGESVAFISHSPEQKSSIRVVDFDGQNARTLYQSKRIGHFPESLSWSPDGRKLLTIIGEHTEGEHNYRLLIIDANAGAQRELTLKNARPLSLRYANWQ